MPWLHIVQLPCPQSVCEYTPGLAQGLGEPVGGLHEASHDLAGALMDELLHPLYGHLIALPKPQLILRDVNPSQFSLICLANAQSAARSCL